MRTGASPSVCSWRRRWFLRYFEIARADFWLKILSATIQLSTKQMSHLWLFFFFFNPNVSFINSNILTKVWRKVNLVIYHSAQRGHSPAPPSHQSKETKTDTTGKERKRNNESYLSGADKDKLQKQNQQRPSKAGALSHDLPRGQERLKKWSFLWDLLGWWSPDKTTQLNLPQLSRASEILEPSGAHVYSYNARALEGIGGLAGGQEGEGPRCR